MLDLVLNLFPEDSKEPQTARILLYKLFYDQTDQGMTQFLLNLVKMFNPHKQPKRFLLNLRESNAHINSCVGTIFGISNNLVFYF